MLTSGDKHTITAFKPKFLADDLNGTMDGIKSKLLFLPNDFLPAKKKLIDEHHCNKHWKYAVHFDSSLPDKRLDESQMQTFLGKMHQFDEYIYDSLTRCLLSHLKVCYNALLVPSCFHKQSEIQSSSFNLKARANFHNLHVEGSSIESIHTAVLSSGHTLDDNYLV